MSCECYKLKWYENALDAIVNAGTETVDKCNNDVIYTKEQTIAMLAFHEVFPEENRIEILRDAIRKVLVMAEREGNAHKYDILLELQGALRKTGG